MNKTGVSPITRDTMKNSSIKSKVRIGIKSGIYSAVKNVSQNKKVFAKTTAERNEERGNVLRHQNTFLIANFAEPGEVNCDLLEIISSTSRFKNIPPKPYFGRACQVGKMGQGRGKTIYPECT